MVEMRKRDLDLKTYRDINNHEYLISTVALTIDHGHGDKPLWYETMIFKSKNKNVKDWGEQYCMRYTTKEEAEQGHERLINANFITDRYGLKVVGEDD